MAGYLRVTSLILMYNIRDNIESTGSQIIFNTPAEFEARVRNDIGKWSRVARIANIKPN